MGTIVVALFEHPGAVGTIVVALFEHPGAALGFRALGFRALGFRALGFRALGFRASCDEKNFIFSSYGILMVGEYYVQAVNVTRP